MLHATPCPLRGPLQRHAIVRLAFIVQPAYIVRLSLMYKLAFIVQTAYIVRLSFMYKTSVHRSTSERVFVGETSLLLRMFSNTNIFIQGNQTVFTKTLGTVYVQ